ncbi:MAG: OsmC family peroxiredoxin [Sphingomonadales bacterium]|nr:MAG: OsmC family peroxiredoxin [Sphingomonadales bacterium]
MPRRTHIYTVHLDWTGNRGTGTSGYTAYDRTHTLTAPLRPAIAGSSDPTFRGDPACWNPEQLLVASLAACHQLWYLHLAAAAGIFVTAYEDDAEGEMAEDADGGGRFTAVTLRPRVTIAGGDAGQAQALHAEAHRLCFIARSVTVPVRHEPVTIAADPVSSPA